MATDFRLHRKQRKCGNDMFIFMSCMNKICTTVQTFGVGMNVFIFFFFIFLICSPKLHLLDSKYSKKQ